MRPVTVSVGPLQGASSQIVRTASSIAGAGPIVLNGSVVGSTGIATLDVARRLLFTSSAADTGIVFTLVGTNAAGAIITENLTGAVSGSTVQSVLDYKTLVSAQSNGASAGTVSIGTSGVASTPWVRFDNWAPGQAGIQINTLGIVTYTVEQTMDDPNSPTNPIAPSQMTWISSSDASAVAATAAIQTNYQYVPIFGRVTINSSNTSSNAGALTATFVQYSLPPL